MSRFARLLVIGALALALTSVAHATGPVPHIGQEEIQTGKDAAADVEKDAKFVQDPQLVERVERIGKSLAEVANSTEIEAGYGCQTISHFDYTFKIIDDKDVNAFSIAGGHIYVYKGLLDFCQSDHELAAVLAHEVAHAAHHHMIYMMREESKLDGKMALVLMAGLLGHFEGEDMSNIMMGTGFYRTAKINGYSQEAEQDADRTGFSYMIKAGYNPVGMLTFLERLADHPELVELGIYRTHPASADRASMVKQLLVQSGIEINRRAVTSSYTALVQPLDSSSSTGYKVIVGDGIICKVKQEDRAQSIAAHLNSLLDQGIEFRDLKLSDNVVTVKNQPLIQVTEGDAGVSNSSANKVASESYEAVRRVILKQAMDNL